MFEKMELTDTDLEIIVVLGGGLFRKADGGWRTTNFSESGDNFGVLGDRVRVVAAAYLSRKNPDLKIIVSGSKGQLSHIPDCPTLSAVLKKELIALSVRPENIIEESESSGTYQQLKKSFDIIRGLNMSRIGIISNEYHLPRINAFIQNFQNLPSDAELISAERIVIEDDPGYWKPVIDEAYASEDMKKRIALEQKGVSDILEGRYILQ